MGVSRRGTGKISAYGEYVCIRGRGVEEPASRKALETFGEMAASLLPKEERRKRWETYVENSWMPGISMAGGCHGKRQKGVGRLFRPTATETSTRNRARDRPTSKRSPEKRSGHDPRCDDEDKGPRRFYTSKIDNDAYGGR